ncbi:MAG: dialkylresorcinol condensing enzyme [Deltaproteobacteria bacterium]|nr:dialkylresorcinol condensing enzyme [Deltaproteobacteria bacterium]
MKRVLVVCYSQTGQLRRCAESLVAPLRDDPDVAVTFVEPEPESPYPFPWGLRAFLGVFPESVLGEPPRLKPLALESAGTYDLVVLCYQPWFLSPSLPVVGFLASPAADVLRGAPVVVLCTCRNMWQRAWLELRRQVEARGGRVIDHLVLEDQGPDWTTFYATPRWLLTGKKEGGPFPPAGVSERDIAALRRPGERILGALLSGQLAGSIFARTGEKTVIVKGRYLIPEMAAKALFRLWARGIRSAGARFPGLRYPLGMLWFAWLVASLPLMPLFIIAGVALRVLRPAWHRARIAELAEPSGGWVQ